MLIKYEEISELIKIAHDEWVGAEMMDSFMFYQIILYFFLQ
jgi:hypothetical protein